MNENLAALEILHLGRASAFSLFFRQLGFFLPMWGSLCFRLRAVRFWSKKSPLSVSVLCSFWLNFDIRGLFEAIPLLLNYAPLDRFHIDAHHIGPSLCAYSLGAALSMELGGIPRKVREQGQARVAMQRQVSLEKADRCQRRPRPSKAPAAR